MKEKNQCCHTHSTQKYIFSLLFEFSCIWWRKKRGKYYFMSITQPTNNIYFQNTSGQKHGLW